MSEKSLKVYHSCQVSGGKETYFVRFAPEKGLFFYVIFQVVVDNTNQTVHTKSHVQKMRFLGEFDHEMAPVGETNGN